MKSSFTYNPDTGVITRIGRKKKTGTLHHSGRLHISFNKKIYQAHRLAWFLFYGGWPTKHIDHINGDPLDNRIVNLRNVSVRENSLNKLEHRAGKLPGCSYRPRHKRWQAQIRIKGKSMHLGNFDTEMQAHEAYMKAVGGYLG